MKRLQPRQESEQFLLFDDQCFAETEAADSCSAPSLAVTPTVVTAAPLPAIVPAKKAAKPVSMCKTDRDFLAVLGRMRGYADSNNLRMILHELGYLAVTFNHHYSIYSFLGDDHLETRDAEFVNRMGWKVLKVLNNSCIEKPHQLNLFWLHPNATASIIPVTFTLSVQQYGDYRQNNLRWEALVTGISVGTIRTSERLQPNTFFLQSETTRREILQRERPWAVKWLDEHPDYKMDRYLRGTWSETLEKAGYRFAKDYLSRNDTYIDNDLDYINRLVKDGTRPKDIFKCSKAVYTVLKDEDKLEYWDTLRRMEKNGSLSADSIRIVYTNGYDTKTLERMNGILSKRKANGNPYFTWESLVNYLRRLDMYEAICTREALQLLYDYLNMCQSLGMTPRTDGDSLKREHDIAARLCREKRNEVQAEKMRQFKEQQKREIAEGNLKLSRGSYREKVYFVEPILDYDTLLDEANQQHNCVASYADSITKGESRIFTLRETAHPDKSLVTIELSPDCRTIRQKLLAYNQPIRNRSITEFIERWHRQLNAA